METLHGHPVADPYRWLEDDDAETHAWRAAQAELCRFHLDSLPGREAVGRRLRELAVGFVSVPVVRDQRTFFLRRREDQEHPVLLAREPDGNERVLIDPTTLSPDHTVTLDDWWPSLDGRLLAYAMSDRGDEESELWVRDVDTGEIVDGPLDRTRSGAVAWLPDGSGYYYVRRLPPDAVPAGEAEYHRRVYRRVLGTAPDRDELVFGEERDKVDFYHPTLSPDGRWLLIHANRGNSRSNDLYIADLGGDAVLRPVIEGVDAQTFASVADDDRLLYLWTNLGAPGGRFVITDPAEPGPKHWRDLLPEGDGVLQAALATQDSVVAFREHHAVGSITLHDRHTGELGHEVKLPGLGAIVGVWARPEVSRRDEFWFAYTDWVTPYSVYHCALPSGIAEPWEAPPDEAPGVGVEARQVFFESKDGTTVPMFVLQREGLETEGPRPTILYGYGGWGISLPPRYSPQILTWVEAEGTYAIANIRGGREYGEAWHRAGMRENKQNVFDDFIAGAEWLIENRYAAPGCLGIEGGSNGGILMGAMLTQRPELFASVVCSAPVLDMVRFDKMPGGEVSHNELGNPGDPREFEWLYAYSPYHRVSKGTDYPATLFVVFESDARVAPWHAYKTCAALQWATSSGQPILLRAEEAVGHAARSLTRLVELTVDTLCFHASRLGLDLQLAGTDP